MTDLDRLLRALNQAGVDFIVIGGVAGIAHGAARLTEEQDGPI
jgi:precorrin-4 methylase